MTMPMTHCIFLGRPGSWTGRMAPSNEEPSLRTGSKCRSRAAIQDNDDDLFKDSRFQKRLDAAVDKEEGVLLGWPSPRYPRSRGRVEGDAVRCG